MDLLMSKTYQKGALEHNKPKGKPRSKLSTPFFFKSSLSFPLDDGIVTSFLLLECLLNIRTTTAHVKPRLPKK